MPTINESDFSIYENTFKGVPRVLYQMKDYTISGKDVWNFVDTIKKLNSTSGKINKIADDDGMRPPQDYFDAINQITDIPRLANGIVSALNAENYSRVGDAGFEFRAPDAFINDRSYSIWVSKPADSSVGGYPTSLQDFLQPMRDALPEITGGPQAYTKEVMRKLTEGIYWNYHTFGRREYVYLSPAQRKWLTCMLKDPCAEGANAAARAQAELLRQLWESNRPVFEKWNKRLDHSFSPLEAW